MNYKWFMILNLSSLVGFFTVSAPAEFEVLSDIDFRFFMNNPKLPWGEDPFLGEPGYSQVEEEKESYTLGGIVNDQDGPLAVVNGKMVHVGEKAGNRLVKKIGENFVILENKKKNSKIELNVPPLDEDSKEESP